MKSKFRFTAYLLSLLGTGFTVMVLMVLSGNALNPTISLIPFILFCSFFAFLWIWLIFGELRTKAISIEIEDRTFVIKRYLGLGTSRRFDLDDISGFKTSILSSKSGSYEYLYLMVGVKKVAKLSMFYHSNYKELKRYIVSMNIKNIGFERFSNRQELKDIFSS
ncbi:hypothetical protein [Mucilaginibacter sp.]|uniref:hypothetical protein n=1 Tax=Mucilaginibacter sp. TaxID=1882438 RepID=UPI0025CD4D55|nr:hypothetical protein [Mucilaginibacter sp.]